MKLIINIPDNVYKRMKDNKDYDYCALTYAIDNGEEITESEWIPIKTRPLTEEEEEVYPDYTFIYDCRMPEDGEEVLITTKYGVCTDIYCWDDCGCYFECHCDDGEVLAWKRFPKPYKEVDNEQ